MNDLIKGLDAVIARARERGRIGLYCALIRTMQGNNKDSLTFEEIKAVFEEEMNNARKES